MIKSLSTLVKLLKVPVSVFSSAAVSHWLLSIYWPITRAGVQWAASLFCIHGGAECGFRKVVMELGRRSVFRSCWVSGGEAFIISVLTQWDEIKRTSLRRGIFSPCSLTEGSLVVLSTHRSTAAPQDCVWTDGWGLDHRWPVRLAEWIVVCRLEEPSLSELLTPSFWDCTL